MWDFAARFFQRSDHYVQMDSMQHGKFRITDAVIRKRGRAAAATSVSTHLQFLSRFSARNFSRFWTRIATSSAQSNTVCSFLYSFSRHSFFLKRSEEHTSELQSQSNL